MAETISLSDVFEELKRIEKKMATKKDVEALMQTVEVLSNPETMKQISASDADIQEGKVKDVTSVKDLL